MLGNLKPGVGSLFCSDNEMEKFRMLQGFSKAKSRIITLCFKRTGSYMLMNLLGITL